MTLDELIESYQPKIKTGESRCNCISNEEISVILQGAVDKIYTPIAIESIKRFLPGAYIIISTWENTDVNGLDCDEVVFNDDPGAPSFIKGNGALHTDNRNRLLLSTKGGIKQVKTKYTLKMRSDCILLGDGIVRNYGKYPKKTGAFSLFKNKLVVGEQFNILNIYFKDYVRPYLFHISDWFFFGLTEDIRTYFEDTELESDEQMLAWKYKNEYYVPADDYMGQGASPRYNSEQYQFIAALKRHYKINYEDISDYSDQACEQSQKAIIDNFEILNISDHEIINTKRQDKDPWNVTNDKRINYLTNLRYEQLYRKLTGGSRDE